VAALKRGQEAADFHRVRDISADPQLSLFASDSRTARCRACGTRNSRTGLRLVSPRSIASLRIELRLDLTLRSIAGERDGVSLLSWSSNSRIVGAFRRDNFRLPRSGTTCSLTCSRYIVIVERSRPLPSQVVSHSSAACATVMEVSGVWTPRRTSTLTVS
jgi:hypothetical protein